jgi:hypothetical protein
MLSDRLNDSLSSPVGFRHTRKPSRDPKEEEVEFIISVLQILKKLRILVHEIPSHQEAGCNITHKASDQQKQAHFHDSVVAG